MYTKIHPYALIIGMAIGFLVFVILRHPLFGLFAGFCFVLIFDLVLKRFGAKDGSDDQSGS